MRYRVIALYDDGKESGHITFILTSDTDSTDINDLAPEIYAELASQFRIGPNNVDRLYVVCEDLEMYELA